jgi:hypothetical protein
MGKGRIFSYLGEGCISLWGWRFKRPTTRDRAEISLKLQLDAYAGPVDSLWSTVEAVFVP